MQAGATPDPRTRRSPRLDGSGRTLALGAAPHGLAGGTLALESAPLTAKTKHHRQLELGLDLRPPTETPLFDWAKQRRRLAWPARARSMAAVGGSLGPAGAFVGRLLYQRRPGRRDPSPWPWNRWSRKPDEPELPELEPDPPS